MFALSEVEPKSDIAYWWGLRKFDVLLTLSRSNDQRKEFRVCFRSMLSMWHETPFSINVSVAYFCLRAYSHQAKTRAKAKKIKKTRLHSSRMRTARLLAVSHSIRWGGVCPTPWMQKPPPNTDPTGCRLPPVDRHLWKHILRKLRLRVVTITSKKTFTLASSFDRCEQTLTRK